MSNFIFRLLFDSRQARAEMAQTRADIKKTKEEVDRDSPGAPVPEVGGRGGLFGSSLKSLSVLKQTLARMFIPVALVAGAVRLADKLNEAAMAMDKIRTEQLKLNQEFTKSLFPSKKEGAELEVENMRKKVADERQRLSEERQKAIDAIDNKWYEGIFKGNWEVFWADKEALMRDYNNRMRELAKQEEDALIEIKKKAEKEYLRWVRDENKKVAEEIQRQFGLRSSMGTVGVGGMSFLSRGIGLSVGGGR